MLRLRLQPIVLAIVLLTATGGGPWSMAYAESVTVEQATRIVQQQVAGRILAVDRVARGGDTLYRFKVLNQGQVRYVYVNATTGAVVE